MQIYLAIALPFCCCPLATPLLLSPPSLLSVGSKLLNCTELLLRPFVCSSSAYWMIFRRRDIQKSLASPSLTLPFSYGLFFLPYLYYLFQFHLLHDICSKQSRHSLCGSISLFLSPIFSISSSHFLSVTPPFLIYACAFKNENFRQVAKIKSVEN